MATVSSIISGRIPWREEPGWLQSIGSSKSRAPLKQGSTQAHKELCVCVCVCVCVCACVYTSLRSPKEGMATLSTILSWRIIWREKPGGLQSIGSAKS